ncbi:MAG: GyrI-like domain-containing protein [SAR324 cluster bacterium]|nr:GyrI-like domain-containing protein [SAR324 cluster bacterium]
MTDKISIVKREAINSLCIFDVVGTMKLGKVMGPAYEKISDSLKEQGIPFGKKDLPFTMYKDINWDGFCEKGIIAMIKMMFFKKWNLQMGITCPDEAKASGKIKKETLSAGKFIRAIHQGPYMKVSETYIKIQAFANKENIALKDYSIEFYLNDPREVAPEDIKTEVLVATR